MSSVSAHLKRYKFTFRLPSGDKIETQELDKTYFDAIVEYLIAYQKDVQERLKLSNLRRELTVEEKQKLASEPFSCYMQIPRGPQLDVNNPVFINLNQLEAYEYKVYQFRKRKNKYSLEEAGGDEPAGTVGTTPDNSGEPSVTPEDDSDLPPDPGRTSGESTSIRNAPSTIPELTPSKKPKFPKIMGFEGGAEGHGGLLT